MTPICRLRIARIVPLAIIVVFAVSTPGTAAGASPTGYGVFQFGAFSERSDDLKDGDVGYDMSLGYGMNFTRAFGLEFDAGYFGTKMTSYFPYGTPYDVGISVYHLGVTTRFGLLDRGFKVFGLAGVSFEGATAQDVFDEYSDTGLGASIGVGLSYRGWGIDLRRYSHTFDFDGNEIDISGLIATVAVRLGDGPPKAAGRRHD